MKQRADPGRPALCWCPGKDTLSVHNAGPFSNPKARHISGWTWWLRSNKSHRRQRRGSLQPG